MSDQFYRGQEFALGDQVTAQKLMDLVNKATVQTGAISSQAAITAGTVAGTDTVLLHDQSSNTLVKATANDILGSNLPVITSSVTAGNGNDIVITPNNATSVTAVAYSSSDGLTVVVTSSAHGLVVGQLVTITAAGTGYNGTFKITAVTAGTFTYVMTAKATIGSGTLTYTKQGAIRTSNKVVSGNLYVDGNTSVQSITPKTESFGFTDIKAFTLPSGNTASRPATPVLGDIRYNTETLRSEIYTGTSWQELGTPPFDASGGDVVLAPEATTTAAKFTSVASSPAGHMILTVSKADASAHVVSEGQIVEIKSSATGYTSFEGVAYDVTTFDFKVKLYAVASALVNQTCTYRKSGRHKIHIFNNSGNLVVGLQNAVAEVLIIGGGGGSVYNGSTSLVGPGGGLAHLFNVQISSSTTYPIVVGGGGVSQYGSGVTAGDGGQSSAFGYIAYGGKGSNNSGTDYYGERGGNNIGDAGGVTGPISSTGNNPAHQLTILNRNNPSAYQTNSYARKQGITFQSSAEVSAYPIGYGEGGSVKAFSPKGVTNATSGVVIIKYPYWVSL